MAKNDDKEQRDLYKRVGGIVRSLFDVSKTTNYSTYNMEKDLFDTQRLLNQLDKVQEKDKDSLKSTIDGNIYARGRLNTFGLLGSSHSRSLGSNGKEGASGKSNSRQQPADMFDIIRTHETAFTELRQHLLLNNRLYEVIGDYEVIRRAIPEVSRVINLLINSVIMPEIISSNTFNINYTFDKKETTERAKEIRDKYELDEKLRVIVENYFVVGAEFITVVPYSSLIEAIKAEASKNRQSAKKSLIKESSLDPIAGHSGKILTESTILDVLSDKMKRQIDTARNNHQDPFSGLGKVNKEIDEFISGIKVYKSNKSLVYDEALVESITSNNDYLFESSFDEMLDKKMKFPKNSNMNKGVEATDGFIPTSSKPSDYDRLQLRGSKIERLDPTRIHPLKIKDTVIAYVYVENRQSDSDPLAFNLNSTMRNNFSFYRMHSPSYNEFSLENMERRILKEIGTRIVGSLSPEFLEANFDQMDVFYEFMREHNLHKERRDIILLHPDDVIEFKRSDGSILQNAVFFAKLYLLMVINNILIKVRRGSDRTIYYVDNGLSNDVEGSVMEAIEAIQQSEIRFSDLGSITGIIGSVGSVVDLFVPQSQDGNKPVSPEVIAGQQVDMDEEFLKYLIKSIILSFNIPSVVVDFTNEVEFAKTLSMANMDVATSSALAQAEINKPLTEMVKRVMAYELDLTEDEVNSISASLIPSRSMLMQVTNELIGITKDLGQSMADANIVDDDEPAKKLFIREFIRKYFNYDWAEIDSILDKIKEDSIEENLKDDVKTASIEDYDDDDAGDDSGETY